MSLADDPVVQAVIAEAVDAAIRRAPTTRVVTGVCGWAEGPDCHIIPDDTPGFATPATRMSPLIVEGSRVKLIYWPGAMSPDAFGPIPDS